MNALQCYVLRYTLISCLVIQQNQQTHKQYSVVNDLGIIWEDWRGFNFAHCQDNFLEA